MTGLMNDANFSIWGGRVGQEDSLEPSLHTGDQADPPGKPAC